MAAPNKPVPPMPPPPGSPPPPPSASTAARLVRIVWLALAALVGGALLTGQLSVPAAWNPWAPLDIDEPPNALTGFKLDRLAAAAPAVCTAWLADAGVDYRPLADQIDAGNDASRAGCGWRNAGRVGAVGRISARNAAQPADPAADPATTRPIGVAAASTGPGVRMSSAFTLTCPATVALALWERHALQPAAAQHLGSRVVAIDHLGSYACRNVYSRAEGKRSEHAAANALDIAGFRLADGRRISVLGDWGPVRTAVAADAASAANRASSAAAAAPSRPVPAEAQFLHAAHDGACRFFRGALGPDYNAAHRDHLHLDRGRWNVCR